MHTLFLIICTFILSQSAGAVTGVLNFPLGDRIPLSNDYSREAANFDWYEEYTGFHAGEDWNHNTANDCGHTVYALGDGVVRDIASAGKYSRKGHVVAIDYSLPNGEVWRSAYFHMRKINPILQKNPDVTASTTIGEVGDWGDEEGEYSCHLHWQIQKVTNKQINYKVNPYHGGTSVNGVVRPDMTAENLSAFYPPSLFVDDRRSTLISVPLSTNTWKSFIPTENVPGYLSYVECNKNKYSLLQATLKGCLYVGGILWKGENAESWSRYSRISDTFFHKNHSYRVAGVDGAVLHILKPGHNFAEDRARYDMIKAVQKKFGDDAKVDTRTFSWQGYVTTQMDFTYTHPLTQATSTFVVQHYVNPLNRFERQVEMRFECEGHNGVYGPCQGPVDVGWKMTAYVDALKKVPEVSALMLLNQSDNETVAFRRQSGGEFILPIAQIPVVSASDALSIVTFAGEPVSSGCLYCDVVGSTARAEVKGDDPGYFYINGYQEECTRGFLSLTLTWLRSEGAQAFNVYRTNYSVETLVATVAGSATGWTDRDILPQERYYYRVEAVNTGGKPRSAVTSGIDTMRCDPYQLPAAITVRLEKNKGLLLEWEGGSGDFAVTRMVGYTDGWQESFTPLVSVNMAAGSWLDSNDELIEDETYCYILESLDGSKATSRRCGTYTSDDVIAVVYDERHSREFDLWMDPLMNATFDHSNPFSGSEDLCVSGNGAWNVPLNLGKWNGLESSQADALSFMIRAPQESVGPGAVVVQIHDMNGEQHGTSTDLVPYVDGGTIDSSWRPIIMPLSSSALKSQGIALKQIMVLSHGNFGPWDLCFDKIELRNAGIDDKESVYTDGPALDVDAWSWLEKQDKYSRDSVYTGSVALKAVFAQQWHHVRFHKKAGFPTATSNTLSFYIKGEGGAANLSALKTELRNPGDRVLGSVQLVNYVSEVEGGWYHIEIPLKHLHSPSDVVTDMYIMATTPNVGIYHIDQVVFK